MKTFILNPIVQVAIILAIASIVIVAFLTHQTTVLGTVLSTLAAALGAFAYRAGWLHTPSTSDVATIDVPVVGASEKAASSSTPDTTKNGL